MYIIIIYIYIYIIYIYIYTKKGEDCEALCEIEEGKERRSV